LRVEQWRDDVRFLHCATLKLHKNAFHTAMQWQFTIAKKQSSPVVVIRTTGLCCVRKRNEAIPNTDSGRAGFAYGAKRNWHP
jgi:hypothetical protein